MELTVTGHRSQVESGCELLVACPELFLVTNLGAQEKT